MVASYPIRYPKLPPAVNRQYWTTLTDSHRKSKQFCGFSDGLGLCRTLANRHMAEGVGFEPTSDISRCRFSRPVPSTARPPLRRSEIKDFSSVEDLDSASLQ